MTHYYEQFELREIDNDSGHLIKVYVRTDHPNPAARMWLKANATLAASPKHHTVVRIKQPHEYSPFTLPNVPFIDWAAYRNRTLSPVDHSIQPTNPFD